MFKLYNILAIAALLVVTGGVSEANAETFYYVTADGAIVATEADTASVALMQATDIQSNSGVISAEAMLGLGGAAMMADSNDVTTVDNDTEFSLTNATTAGATTDDDMETYAYVSSAGQIKYVVAATPEAALALANDIALHSGVVVTAN